MAQYVAVRALNRSANIRVAASQNVYRLTIAATAGQFKLVITGQADGNSDTTADIAYNASTSTVKTALSNLTTSPDLTSTDVAVTGGPGDSTGSTPYYIAFYDGAGDQEFIVNVIDGTTPMSGGDDTQAVAKVGREVKLSPTVDTVIDLDRTSNTRALAHHSAIGQWIITAANAYDGTNALPTNS